MKNLSIYILLLVLFLGCSSDSTFTDSDLIGKTFDHLFFSTLKECRAAQPDPNFFINCHQELEILNQKELTIVLTDIVNQTEYQLRGNLLIIKASNTTEFANDLVFEILDEQTLRRSGANTIWNERLGASPWD